ncbi:MAG: hypothetical protein ACOCV2_00900 [Persicimonas sp.]
MLLSRDSDIGRGLVIAAGLLVAALALSACGGEDPCADRVCEFGVCDAGTGECVNASECDRATDCLPGYRCGADGACRQVQSCDECDDDQRCVDGRCVGGDAVCDEVECERGVCRAPDAECVNADDCDGDDSRCLAGYFCGEADRCRPDLCERNGVNCEEGGVCVESVGECENPRRCEGDEDCLSDHRCVESRCRLEDAMCGDGSGDGGCAGERECRVRDQVAECVEPDECTTSIDCDEGRQCSGRECIEMTGCHNDELEPNDTVDEASDFHRVSHDNTVAAGLCGDDRDVFVLQTSDLVGAPTRGTLVVEATVLENDRGLGAIEVSVDGLGGGVRTADTGHRGRGASARIEEGINASSHGELVVEVSGAGELAEAGVAYELSVNLVPDEALDACAAAEQIEPGEPLRADTNTGESSHLGSSCTDLDNNRLEKIYALEIEEPSRLDVSIAPVDNTTDLAVSLRESCAKPGTERACIDRFGGGGRETLSRLLEPGRYYLVVEAPPGESGGAFDLSTEATPTTCAGSMAHCVDADTARHCAYRRGSYETVECDEGCDASTGRCAPPEGDTCATAPLIDGSQAGVDEPVVFEETLDLSTFDDTYNVTGDGCLGRGGDLASGADKTYRVEVPAGTSLSAELEMPDGMSGSLYLFDECEPDSGSCWRGARVTEESDDRERLVWPNETDVSQTVYLVADTAEGQLLEEVGVEIRVEERFCEIGGDFRCEPNGARSVEVCGASGAEWVDEIECDWTCDDETTSCTVPDSCASASDVTEAARRRRANFEVDWETLSNHQEELICGMPDDTFYTPVSGQDAFMKVDLAKGEQVGARLRGCCQGRNLVVVEDCQEPGDACPDADFEWSPIDQQWEVAHTADADETVYLIADIADTGGSQEPDPSDLEVVVREPCDASSDETACLDDETVRGCRHDDDLYDPWHCEGGCDDGRCGERRGMVCADALPIDGGTSRSYGFGTAGGTIPDDDIEVGECEFGYGEWPAGHQRVFEVDLDQGEELHASVSRPTNDTSMYLMEDCFDAETCLENTPTDGSGELTHVAEEDQTLYLVVDAVIRVSPEESFTLTVDVE